MAQDLAHGAILDSPFHKSTMNPKAKAWQPGCASPILPAPGTQLFDQYRERFCDGISRLDYVLNFFELRGTAEGKAHTRGIDKFLTDMLALARWLVAFLDKATTCQKDSLWTRSAITGLRVELHRYSWKVTKLSMMMKWSPGSNEEPMTVFAGIV